MNSNFVVAKYLRISSDDGFHGDSQSISGQRELIDDFISSHEELRGAQCVEFCDDGFTGMNFNRPGVERLLNEVNTGRVHCIVVKDLSRFGRNYIKVGEYIEVFFPFLSVRFISINDGYDSAKLDYQCADISVAFKNLCNDYYCKDLSNKVKSGIKSKWESGKYLASYEVYGYKKCDEDRYRLVRDDETAPIVRRVFNMALSGRTPTQIAAEFNIEGIPTPMVRLSEKRNIRTWSNLAKLWTNTKIISFIRDLRYTGALTQGMYAVCGFENQRIIKTPKSDWYISENAHEPIVSKEEYEKAQLCVRTIKTGGSKSRIPSPYSFPVKIRCGGCGHALVKNNAKVMAYYCRYKLSSACENCFAGRIGVDALRKILLTSIQRLFDIADSLKRPDSKEASLRKADTLKQIQSLEREINSTTNSKLALYTRYSDGEISRDEYFTLRDSADKRIEELSAKLDSLEQKSFRQNNETAVNPIVEALQNISYPAQYTNEIVAALVEHVVVYDENRVEIKWRFSETAIYEYSHNTYMSVDNETPEEISANAAYTQK